MKKFKLLVIFFCIALMLDLPFLAASQKEIPPYQKDSVLKKVREQHHRLPPAQQKPPGPNQKIERPPQDSNPAVKGDTFPQLTPRKKSRASQPVPIRLNPDTSAPGTEK